MFSRIWNAIKEFFLNLTRSKGFPEYDFEYDKLDDDCSAPEMPFVEELAPKKRKKSSKKKTVKSKKKRTAKHK